MIAPPTQAQTLMWWRWNRGSVGDACRPVSPLGVCPSALIADGFELLTKHRHGRFEICLVLLQHITPRLPQHLPLVSRTSESREQMAARFTFSSPTTAAARKKKCSPCSLMLSKADTYEHKTVTYLHRGGISAIRPWTEEWPYGYIGGCPYLLLFKQLNLSLRTHTKVKTHTSMSLRLRYTARLPGP
jgi:hypothetical protein